MIHSLRARNYGCLLDVDVSLSPLHAFVGPNDSGKSTLLNALRTLFQLPGDGFDWSEKGEWLPFDPYFDRALLYGHGSDAASRFMLACADEGGWFMVRQTSYFLEARLSEQAPPSGMDEAYFQSYGTTLQHAIAGRDGVRFIPTREANHPKPVIFSRARLVRFDPDALRATSGLLPEDKSVAFLDERGHGLPGVYFALRNRDDDTYKKIVDEVRRHFPTIKYLRVKAVTSSTVILEAELNNGTRVEAKRFSEGLLYFLAFAALRYMDPVRLLLVEEPENGLHPARIAEVIKILRNLTEEQGTQVIMATHSPLVVNELKADEVSVVTRDTETGTRVKRICETPDFEERAKVYSLGELWIAYANGVDEAPLLQGTEP